jgi:hypothetical protein
MINRILFISLHVYFHRENVGGIICNFSRKKLIPKSTGPITIIYYILINKKDDNIRKGKAQ